MTSLPQNNARDGTKQSYSIYAHQGDQRLAVFYQKRGWQLGIFGAAVTVLWCATAIIAAHLEIKATELKTISIDFFVFWAAAKLALQGVPLDAFDPQRLIEIAATSTTAWMAWLYPPGFLLLITPLGLMPFAAAWAVFSVLSVGALWFAVKPFCAGKVQVILCVALAPAILPTLLNGQVSVLWCAGLVGALAALRAERPVLAGVLIGLLTLKPQLGLLIPFALLACSAWRTIIAATLTTILISGVPTLIYGAEYWAELLTIIERHGTVVRGAVGDLNLLIGPYATLISLGLSENAALPMQWVVTAFCAAAVFWTWRKVSIGFDLRAATLLTAIPLSSPYLWYYEAAMMAPAALFMLRAGVLDARALTAVLGIAFWLGLGPYVLLQSTFGPNEVVQLVFLPLACIAFALCLRDVMLSSSKPKEAA